MNIATVINLLKQEDNGAFRHLVSVYSGRLMAVAKLYTRNHADAQDVLQEGLIVVFEKVHQFEGDEEKAFYGWMKKIVVNLALNKYRRKRSSMETLNIDDQYDIAQEPEVYKSFANQDLLSAMYQLPHKYKQVIGLVAIEGYNHREVSDMLGMKESTSRSIYSRAKKMLLKIILKSEKVA
jgi:RNA polymerase sigma factor (sigma-70 family)